MIKNNLFISSPKDIIRICRICRCRSDEVPFILMRDTRTGRKYVHNICRPCRIEENRKSRLKRLAKDPKHDIRQAAAWNRANKDRYNKRRRENYAKKKAETLERISYLYKDNIIRRGRKTMYG